MGCDLEKKKEEKKEEEQSQQRRATDRKDSVKHTTGEYHEAIEQKGPRRDRTARTDHTSAGANRDLHVAADDAGTTPFGLTDLRVGLFTSTDNL